MLAHHMREDILEKLELESVDLTMASDDLTYLFYIIIQQNRPALET